MINYSDSYNEMYAMFAAKWNSESSSIVGYIPEIRQANIEKIDTLPVDKVWCRFSRQTVGEEQSTLRNGTCGKTYESDGLIFIQMFAPLSDNNSLSNLQKLAEISKSAYRGKQSPGGIWFKNVRVNELDPEDDWVRINVVAQYEYTEND